ncbi:MAG: cysteine desulfurase [Acidobacteriota bacterium]|nr:cysteine desulfurase [Acidobacteriota bacterium]
MRAYFDHNATTPVCPEALEAMLPALREVYGNASSIHHFGQQARQRLEAARRETASLIGCGPRDIVFVSGGTEADNLAIFGVVRAHPAERKHVVTSTIEHPAVLASCARLEREGIEVTYVPAGADGVIDPDDVRDALRPETVLISIMHANNELGTIQPVEEIARIAREAGVVFHSDGVQAAGRIPVDVRALGVDLYSISGHKLYAPKGIGALYVKPGIKLDPVAYGGRHEQQRRAGTENVAGAVALGVAAAVARERLDSDMRRIADLRDRLERGILNRVPDCGVSGARVSRAPNTTNIYFDGLEGEALLIALDLKGFAVSSGAACSSGAVEPSHVLLAIGMDRERARASLRFSLGRSNTAEQVDALIDAVAESSSKLRKLSPTYTVSV